MRKLATSQKIAQLERRVAKMEKEAKILEVLKSLFYRIPKRLFKSIYQEVMFLLVRIFRRNSKVIEKYVWSHFEAHILNNQDLKLQHPDFGWVKPRLHKFYHKAHPYKTEIEFPNLVVVNIEGILEILDGKDNEFSAIFKEREAALIYAWKFYKYFAKHKLSWMGLYGPVLFAAQGKPKYLNSDGSLSAPIMKHYKKKAMSVVSQLGLLPLAILNHFIFALFDETHGLLELLFYILITLPFIKPAKFLYSIFKKIFNKDPKNIHRDPPTEVQGKPLLGLLPVEITQGKPLST